MGCTASGGDYPRNWQESESLVALVITDRTREIKQMIEKQNTLFNPNAALNFKGDTLLHYACARGNVELVEYLVSREDILCGLANKLGEKPIDLAAGNT